MLRLEIWLRILRIVPSDRSASRNAIASTKATMKVARSSFSQTCNNGQASATTNSGSRIVQGSVVPCRNSPTNRFIVTMMSSQHATPPDFPKGQPAGKFWPSYGKRQLLSVGVSMP